MKMGEWLERKVRLRQNMETRGGHPFKKGEILVVDSHWRGRLNLVEDGKPRHYMPGAGRRINQVERIHVELLP